MTDVSQSASVDNMVREAALATSLSSPYGSDTPSGLVVNKIIYANSESSTLETSILNIRQGTLHLPATSTNLSSTLTFTIPNRDVYDIFYINGTITLPHYSQLCSNWFLRAVDSINISLPGQGTYQYSGISAWTHLMRSSSVEQRNALNSLMPAVSANSETALGSYVYRFVCPMQFPWSGALTPDASWPIDAGASSNNIIVSLTMKPVYQWLYCSSGNTMTFPTAFDQIELKVLNIISPINQVMQASRITPVVKTPFNYLQTYNLSGISFVAGAEKNVQLSNLPEGQLTSIYVSIIDQASLGQANGARLASLLNIPLTYMRLNYNGLDLIELDQKELRLMQLYNSAENDNGMQYELVVPPYVAGASATVDQSINIIECFAVNTAEGYTNGAYSITQNYQGMQFSLYVKTDVTATCDVVITYVINSVLVLANGAASFLF